MRLLNAKTYKLESFADDQVPLYAILSHRWGSNEISFQDVEHIQDGIGEGYDKIRKTCSIANAHGFDYAWVDICCIDKTSSAELSEAINSMFRWYQESGLCYAYLSDLPSDDLSPQTETPYPDFEKSTWFTRGWALQELIAPSGVIFFNQKWQEIGTKISLQARISAVTGIPGEILQGADLWSAGIAQRMSWASKRKTTRVEDVAYCLMGIFDVNMPMLYGEGEKAFTRLQEEIMKVSDDHSLFAWGSVVHDDGLLAPSPAAFLDSTKIIPNISSDTSSGAITVNNKGIHLELSSLDIDRPASQRVLLVVLPCEVEGSPETGVGIYLKASSDTRDHWTRAKGGTLELIELRNYKRSKFIRKRLCIKRERRSSNYQLPLKKAAVNGHEVIVRQLLGKGVHSVQGALKAAAASGHQGTVSLLLERVADLDLGRDALQAAVENGHEAIVELLLDKGVKVDQQILQASIQSGLERVVKLLLDKGANISQYAFQVAAENGHEAVVKLLLEKEANPNRGVYGAAWNGHEGVVKLLLEKVFK